jgi:hypothetical protein
MVQETFLRDPEAVADPTMIDLCSKTKKSFDKALSPVYRQTNPNPPPRLLLPLLLLHRQFTDITVPVLEELSPG